MKILCSYSSLTFTCDYFPAYLHNREACHPIFAIPQRKLLPYLSKWAANELTPTDSYLLFLAVLNSSDLVEFRSPAKRTENTNAIIAQNMEALFKTVIKLNTVSNPAVVFPRYVVSTETAGLDNVRYWIENWADAYRQFQNGYHSAHESAKLIHREQALERLIKNPHKPISAYSAQIADWAALAGSFPTFTLISPLTNKETTCAEYWKTIISKAASELSIYSLPRKDIEELLQHCEENISINEMGSIYSHALFKILRKALERQKNFLGFGDIDAKSTYEILEASTSIEDANLMAAIQAAPDHEPKPEEYPTKFAFMKAKFRWTMSKRYEKESEAAGAVPKESSLPNTDMKKE